MFAFATSRRKGACKRFADVLKPDAAIHDGGALALAGGRTVYNAAISGEVYDFSVKSETPEAVERIVRDFPDVYALRFTGEDRYLVRNKKAAAEYRCGDCDADGVAEWIEKNIPL